MTLISIVATIRLIGADVKVKEKERVEALRERAQIIVESERTHPGSHQYHKYMHIVQATDSSNAIEQLEWEGITGRVKQLLELQDERVKHMFELQDERVNERVQQLLESHGLRVEQYLDNKFELFENKLQRALSNGSM